jgi:putative heme transporter
VWAGSRTTLPPVLVVFAAGDRQIWTARPLSIRAEALELLRGRWFALTAATLVNQLTGYLMLELSLRALGISGSEVSVVESFAAWSVGRLLASLPLTPGGIGVVELGLTATLIRLGGVG